MQSLPEPQAQILCGFRQCWLPSLCFFICPEELGAAVGNEKSTPQACAPQAYAPLACTMCSSYHPGISCPTPTPNFTGLRHPYPRHRRGLTLHRTNPREEPASAVLRVPSGIVVGGPSTWSLLRLHLERECSQTGLSLKARQSWSGVDINPKCLSKRPNGKGGHMGESHVTMKVTMLPLCLQAKKCWAWPAAATVLGERL